MVITTCSYGVELKKATVSGISGSITISNFKNPISAYDTEHIFVKVYENLF